MAGLFRGIGLPELLIVLVIVVLLFGIGRLSKVGSELGKGIRNFRQALSGGEGKENPEESPASDEQA